MLLSTGLYSDDNTNHLMDIPLNELMKQNVSFGTFTGIEQSKIPGSITIISAEDIAITPARNILDLIEVYVPGATYVMHYNGPRLGIRGNLSDQNYSYQLLLNGKNINLKASSGPIFELQDKALSSIERIEIISGSGSAVFGPGATAGIINIITKRAEKEEMSLSYKNDLNYRYEGVSLQYSGVENNFKYYLYGSVYKSLGLRETKFWYIDRAQNLNDNQPYGWGYMGPDWGNYNLGTDAANYLGDYLDVPETKLHFDLDIKENTRIWMRYSTYNHINNTQESITKEGPEYSGRLGKYYAVEISNIQEPNSKLRWTNKVGFDSASIRHINLYQRDSLSVNHIAQLGNSYSENEVTGYSLLNYNLNGKYKFALGGEYSYEYYRPEWGMDDESFILSFQAPIRFAVMNENSGFYKFYGEPIANVIDGEINGKMASVFGEANLKFDPKLQILLSLRADKHEYSDLGISPRISVISELNSHHLVNLILERSVRLPLFTDLFAQDYLSGEPAEPEVKTGAEVKYQYSPNQNINFKSSVFYYTVDQIGWLGDTEFTDVIGKFNLVGIEPEFRYQKEGYSIGANYSFIKQLDWEPKIPYEAYIVGFEGEEIELENNGNVRINNLPAHAIKIFSNHTITPRITMHLDGRLMWDYQQQEMLDKFEDAHDEYGNPVSIDVLDQIISDLHDHGYAKPSFTTNGSLNWTIYKAEQEVNINIQAMNLLSYNHLRYVIQFWETGNLRQYPRQCGFIEEPFTIDLRIEWKY